MIYLRYDIALRATIYACGRMKERILYHVATQEQYIMPRSCAVYHTAKPYIISGYFVGVKTIFSTVLKLPLKLQNYAIFALRTNEICLRHMKYASRVKYSLTRKLRANFISHSAISRIFHIERKRDISLKRVCL